MPAWWPGTDYGINANTNMNTVRFGTWFRSSSAGFVNLWIWKHIISAIVEYFNIFPCEPPLSTVVQNWHFRDYFSFATSSWNLKWNLLIHWQLLLQLAAVMAILKTRIPHFSESMQHNASSASSPITSSMKSEKLLRIHELITESYFQLYWKSKFYIFPHRHPEQLQLLWLLHFVFSFTW